MIGTLPEKIRVSGGHRDVIPSHSELQQIELSRLEVANKFKAEVLDFMEAKNRRIKRGNRSIEKNIYEVINLVSLWIRLSNGKIHLDANSGRFRLGPGSGPKLDRDEAARILHTPKKSLNDYLLHLRYGRHFGFDFVQHKFHRMGILRHFVEIKKKDSKQAQGCLRISYIKPDEFLDNFDFLDLFE